MKGSQTDPPPTPPQKKLPSKSPALLGLRKAFVQINSYPRHILNRVINQELSRNLETIQEMIKQKNQQRQSS